jgi:K+-transporting ATPase KdpF subunit
VLVRRERILNRTEIAMGIIIVSIIALALFVYLLAAVLRPDRF